VARRHQRAKIEEYAGYYFVVLYAAHVNVRTRRIRTAELQFFWGPNYLVTIRSEPFPQIDDLIARAHAGALAPVVGVDHRSLAIADLVYRLVDAIVDGYFPAVDALAEWIEDIEDTMFAAPRQRASLSTPQALFGLKKDLLHMRKTIAPCREVLNVLLRRDQTLFDDQLLPYFQDIYDHTVRTIDSLDTYRDLLASVLDTHLAMVSNEVSVTVRRMTAITAVLMVNALIAGIYGMNFDLIPELHWQYGYPYSLGLMGFTSAVLIVVFRRIGWL
jgi:magnesium transporter